MRYCSLCRHDIRDWARHQASGEHIRNRYPVGSSRRGGRSIRRRERKRSPNIADQSASWADRMWALEERAWRAVQAAVGRHYHGAWRPWGKSASEGGRPVETRPRTVRRRWRRR